MGLLERIADAQYRFFKLTRHRGAARVTDLPTTPDLESLRGYHYCLLTTFRRNGEAMPTPVGFGLGDGKLYARSEERVGKVKRIRANPRVIVAPCNSRGKPLGPAVEGTARILATSEIDAAYRALAASWSPLTRIYERSLDRMPVELAYIEVAPSSPAT
jgi:PPOX class probable F420-dependent enzyme